MAVGAMQIVLQILEQIADIVALYGLRDTAGHTERNLFRSEFDQNIPALKLLAEAVQRRHTARHIRLLEAENKLIIPHIVGIVERANAELDEIGNRLDEKIALVSV